MANKLKSKGVDTLPTTRANIPKIFKKQHTTSKRGLSKQYENSETCWAFYNGDQMTYADRIQFEDQWGRRRRAIVNFNKVQQPIDAVVGFFAQNRRVASYVAHVPLNQGQQLYSKNMNALKEFHREFTNADQLETEQDTDMMINGYGAVDTDISYIIGNATTMPNGEIVKKKIGYDCVYWDPSAKAKNLLDARWCGYYEDYELGDALSLFQGSVPDDFEKVGSTESKDTGYVFNPYGGIYDKIKMEDSVEWASEEANMVRVYNHQWMVYETYYRAANPIYEATDPLDASFIKLKLEQAAAEVKLPGDTAEDDSFALDPLAEELTFNEATKQVLARELSGLIEPIPFKRKVFYTAVISGKHVFTWFKSISQSGFSIKFKTGTWSATNSIWMGMVNPLMEPQRYSNKALTELLFTIAANSKGGVYVEDDAVEDIADFETKYAKTDGVIVVRSGALAAGKIQDKARPAVPTGLDTIIQLADANINSNGVDPSFLGDLDREDQSGILYKRRIKQVLSKFARYADSITLYQKEDSRLMADLIRVWVDNNLGQFVKITGEDGADDFVKLAQDMLAPDYDVSIQEAPQSTEEKQETSSTLAAFGDKLLAVGDVQTGKAMYNQAIQFMRIDGDVRNKLSQILQPQQPQVDPQQFAQMQQQLQQLQQYIQSGQVDKTKSETQKNMATAMKTMQDVQIGKATVPKIHSETVKTLEDAHKVSIEAQVAKRTPDPRVVI